MYYLIHHALERKADTIPEHEAVVHESKRFSYLEVEQKANKIANWLLEKGIKKGDRIALLLKNSINYITAYYGILKSGTVAVPLNTGLTANEVNQLLDDCQARILLTEPIFSNLLHEIIADHKLPDHLSDIAGIESFEGCSKETILVEQIFDAFSHQRPLINIIDQDMASIIYTSGSTGKPKGVVLSHLNVVTNTKSIVSYLSLEKIDRCMVVLPFYYVYGKSLLNTHFAVGGTIIIDNRFTFPNVVLTNMIKENVTGFAGVPSTYSILLNKSAISKMTFPQLRYLTLAGGHMPLENKKRLITLFPTKKIFIMYGATEASARLSYLPPEEIQKRIKSIGKAIPNVELKLVLENGDDAPNGQEGQIVARGTNIMSHYWNNPDETQEALINGWYQTGDLGTQDQDGFLYITGRKRDMIKVGIYKVSALEIEEVLHNHPAVFEAAVIGMLDEVLGEAPQAYVVLKEKIDKNELENFCMSYLPPYKIPKQFVVLQDLPKNESGKILKSQLGNFTTSHQ
ncbi:class I adenylate-forming enzyme family protein [Thermodesulfobacteriota bacterium]